MMAGNVAMALVAASIVLQIVNAMAPDRRAGRARRYLELAAHGSPGVAGVALFGALVQRTIVLGFPALITTYDALTLMGAGICVAALVAVKDARPTVRRPPSGATLTAPRDRAAAGRLIRLGATVVAAVLVGIGSSPLVAPDVAPPVPALRSVWLVLHVTTAAVGEAFFAVGFAASVAQLSTKDRAGRVRAEMIAYRAIVIGYLLFGAGGLVFGGIWAYQAWGRFWGWDPKETWALVTFLVYSLYLHLRLTCRRDSRLLAAVSVIGFLVTLFTFLGVNYLLPGLHSYG